MTPDQEDTSSGFILLDAVSGASVACIFALGLFAMVSFAHQALRERSTADNALRLASHVLNSFSIENGLNQTGSQTQPNLDWSATATIESMPGFQQHGVVHLEIVVRDYSGSVVAEIESKRLIGNGG